LADFKKDGKSTRNDENIELNYLKGKYGALPILGDFENQLNRQSMAGTTIHKSPMNGRNIVNLQNLRQTFMIFT
jgi:hypothetical protein